MMYEAEAALVHDSTAGTWYSISRALQLECEDLPISLSGVPRVGRSGCLPSTWNLAAIAIYLKAVGRPQSPDVRVR